MSEILSNNPKRKLSKANGALEAEFFKFKRSAEIDFHFCFSMRNNYLYFPVPKAANSTVKLLLSRQELGPGHAHLLNEETSMLHNHMVGPLLSPMYFRTREDILREVCIDGDFFRFSMVRNPYTRILSCYLDRFCRKGMTYRYMQRQSSRYGLPFKVGKIISFLEFVKLTDAIPTIVELDQHIRPQYAQIHADIIPYDAIAKFENLHKDMEIIFRRIFGKNKTEGFSNENASPSVTSAGEKIAEHYCAESAEIVKRIYAKDFQAFKYDTELRI